MSSDKPDNYGLEPGSTPGTSPQPASDLGVPHTPTEAAHDEVSRPAPIEVEPLDRGPRMTVSPNSSSTTAKSSVHDLDVCPSCGAPMTGPDTLVCIRCGFDLKTMKPVQTTTGAVTQAELDEAQGKPLVQAGMGDLWLPGALATVCGLLLLVCYLAGVHGLFPLVEQGADVPISTRVAGIGQFIVLSIMWAGCSVAALAFLAHLMGQRLGDLQLAAVRMLAIVVAVRIFALIDFPNQLLEHSVEALLQAAAFAGLVIAFFRLNPRDALTLLGSAIVLFVGVWMFSYLVIWATAA